MVIWEPFDSIQAHHQASNATDQNEPTPFRNGTKAEEGEDRK